MQLSPVSIKDNGKPPHTEGEHYLTEKQVFAEMQVPVFAGGEPPPLLRRAETFELSHQLFLSTWTDEPQRGGMRI